MRKMVIGRMLRRINKVLPELILGIIAYGVAVQLIGVWFVADKLRYSTGLWVGILTAVGMGIHIAIVLEDATAVAGENQAKTKIVAKSVLRYVVVAAVFAAVVYFRLGNIVTLFLGVMGLKAGAYLQPFTHKVIQKLSGTQQQN